MKNLNQKISTVGATSSRPILQRQDPKQNNGITLIALVITIIVLLILAGVTINMLTGESGILKNANLAAFSTKVRAVEEQLELKMVMNIENRENMNYTNWTGGATTGTIKEIIPEIENDLAKILAIEDGYLIFTEEATKEEKEMLLSLNIYGESIKIRTAEELRQIATEVQNGRTYENEKIKLMNDIDLGATWDEEGNLLTGTAWTPIGTYAGASYDVEDIENSREFKGIFDGNNYTIKNMYISQESGIGTGLFAYCGENSIIKNVQLGDGYIKGYQETGGIVGRTKGIVENCINNGTTINGKNNDAGGIAGRNLGTIENCKNFVEINGLAYVGGISGSAGIKVNSHAGGEIINCENNGRITSNVTSYENIGSVGGIVGWIYNASITGCINNGDIYSEGIKNGGIVGIINYDINSVKNCKNYGDITGAAEVGGIVGNSWGTTENDKTKISNCINEGNITATREVSVSSDGYNKLYVGGIAGYATRTEIYNCYNKGNVTGTYGGWVGGISGNFENYSKILQCVNEGYILGKEVDIAGVCGACAGNSIIANSYNKGKIESTTRSASGISGIIGWDTPGEVYNCYNIGTIIRLYGF